MADTFDIVLFQTSTSEGKKLRDVMKSDFDHVGMVVKYQNKPDDVFILEIDPNSNKGVQI